MTPAVKLPEKLSDLLDLAVRDAQACEADPKFKLWMQEFVRPNGVCRVCMAGAVMVQRGLCTVETTAPSGMELNRIFDAQTRDALFDIDDLRKGEFPEARDISAAELDAAQPALFLIAEAYDRGLDGGRAPWDVYLKAAQMLREAGL